MDKLRQDGSVFAVATFCFWEKEKSSGCEVEFALQGMKF